MGESTKSPAGDVVDEPEAPGRNRQWVSVGTLAGSAVGAVVIGLLNVMGAGTSLLVNLLMVVGR